MSNPSVPFLVARGEKNLCLLPGMANRHGLIAGATGTGKTVTLQVLAEHFSTAGVPVFMADVKGDLAGISQPGTEKPRIRENITRMGLASFTFRGFPVAFWDLFGKQGHPVRTTISEMGPLLLSRLLNLNETQGGVLSLVFRIADDSGLLLLDMKDLRSMLEFVGTKTREFTTSYGAISTASIGAIQRGLLVLDEQGGDIFFGEPALNLDDFMCRNAEGFGVVNILAADRLMSSPRVYATFLLWLLSELFERLPEVGDLPLPKLVFFFDEAHLLFDEAPKVLVDKIEQVIRLIRSKGVGVYFITQNPIDIPDTILGQLGNRIQHALRAFTPKDQKAVKVAAETFRANPKLNIESAITELAVGEALISLLDEQGRPGIVERAMICPPHSQIGPVAVEERRLIIQSSLHAGIYERVIDRESAYEVLKKRTEEALELAERERQEQESYERKRREFEMGYAPRRRSPYRSTSSRHRRPQSQDVLSSIARIAMSTAGREVSRQIMRGMLGGIMGGKR